MEKMPTSLRHDLVGSATTLGAPSVLTPCLLSRVISAELSRTKLSVPVPDPTSSSRDLSCTSDPTPNDNESKGLKETTNLVGLSHYTPTPKIANSSHSLLLSRDYRVTIPDGNNLQLT